MEFLLAPLVVGTLVGVIAWVIAIVNKYLNDYGIVKVDINSGKEELEVQGGDPLLSTLSERSIYLPSACGGKGSCGACKCKVDSDIGPILPTEKPYLTEEEIKEGMRLACQIKVKSDIDITIPEELFNVKEFCGTIEKIKDLTYDIKEVLIAFDDNEEIDFTAGMYVQLQVPGYGKGKGKTQRAYSVSSTPSLKNKVELLIRYVPKGVATTWVHSFLEVGDKIKVVGPFGDFRRTEKEVPMICIAGGSGMAPFKSFFYDMIEKEGINRDVYYFFGARTTKDLFYLDELRELDEKWEKFHFIPALSAPEGDEKWSGEVGLITDIVDKYLKETIKTSEVEGYLCGSPGMIDACNKVFTDNGVSLSDVYYDKFA